MHGLLAEVQSAVALCAMLALVFAGIRTMLDPQALLSLLSHLSKGIRRFHHSRTGSPWLQDHPAGPGEFQDRGARRFARMIGLVITMLGLLGIFEQLTRLA